MDERGEDVLEGRRRSRHHPNRHHSTSSNPASRAPHQTGKPGRRTKTSKHHTPTPSSSSSSPYRSSSTSFSNPIPDRTRSTSSTAYTQASVTSSTTSSLPSTSATGSSAHNSSQHHGLSSGSLAAAIVAPILAVIILAIGAFCLLRRRGRDPQPRNASNRLSALSFPSMREKEKNELDVGRNPEAPATPPPSGSARESAGVNAAAPIITSSSNNAYYTGIDTSPDPTPPIEGSQSPQSDGDTFAEPPPPYKAKHTGGGTRPSTSSVHGDYEVYAKTGNSTIEPSASATTSVPGDAPVSPLDQSATMSHLPRLDLGAALPSFMTMNTDDNNHDLTTASNDRVAIASSPVSSVQATNPSSNHPATASQQRQQQQQQSRSQQQDEPKQLTLFSLFSSSKRDPSAGGSRDRSERPRTARSTSNASITSTLYSDSASVHSAHAAAAVTRGSVVGPAGGSSGGSGSIGSGGGADSPDGGRASVSVAGNRSSRRSTGGDPFVDPSSSAPTTPTTRRQSSGLE